MLTEPVSAHRPGPRLRVLVVAPFVPAVIASHGASAAIGDTLSALTRHHDVSLIYLRGPEEFPLDDELAAQLRLVREVRRPDPASHPGRKTSILLGLLRGWPMWAQQWWSPQLAADLVEIVERWKPDVVQVELSVMARYVKVLKRHQPKVIFAVHDPAVPAAKTELHRHRGALWLLHAADVWAWRRAEKVAARNGDSVLVFTEADARQIEWAAGPTPISVIPLGVPIPKHPLHAAGTEPATALFVGSSRHPPNVEAVQRLCMSLLPRLVTQVPKVRLEIIGHYPAATVTDDLREHVTMLDRVPSVAPYLDKAAVVVAPLRLGGGMRVKVLEALAAGKAVVGTSIAFAGLTVVQDGAAIGADDDDSFAAAVAWLMNDDDARRRLGERARAWALTNLSWNQRLRRYDELFGRLTNSHPTDESLAQGAPSG